MYTSSNFFGLEAIPSNAQTIYTLFTEYWAVLWEFFARDWSWISCKHKSISLLSYLSSTINLFCLFLVLRAYSWFCAQGGPGNHTWCQGLNPGCSYLLYCLWLQPLKKISELCFGRLHPAFLWIYSWHYAHESFLAVLGGTFMGCWESNLCWLRARQALYWLQLLQVLPPLKQMVTLYILKMWIFVIFAQYFPQEYKT